MPNAYRGQEPLNFIYVHVRLPVCIYVHMHADTQGGQQRASDSLGARDTGTFKSPDIDAGDQMVL